MQGQPEMPEPPREGVHHALRIVLAFEGDAEVVGIPDQGGLAPKPGLHPPLEPAVEGVVQIDVPEQRGEHRTLCGPGLRRSG